MTTDKAPTRKQIARVLKEMGENTIVYDGFEAAFLGFGKRINEPTLAVYSLDDMVKVCMHRDGMTFDEALEFVEYNCVGAWIDERTPLIVVNPFTNGRSMMFANEDDDS